MSIDRRLRVVRLAEAMKEFGISRDAGVAFGRPRIAGHGAVVVEVVNNFLGGDSIASIAKAWDLKREQVENAIRFVLLYPEADLPSFWNDAKTRDYRKYLNTEK